MDFNQLRYNKIFKLICMIFAKHIDYYEYKFSKGNNGDTLIKYIPKKIRPDNCVPTNSNITFHSPKGDQIISPNGVNFSSGNKE